MTAGPAYHRVPVAEVIAETADAVSLVLAVPPELAGTFAYRPGQFLTVRVPHPVTGSVDRCYSLSSSPHTDATPKITVKRTTDGHASNWICDHVTPGSLLDLRAPAGRFVPASLDGDLLLLAGGSGITPVLSIITSVLAAGRGHLALLYANRDERSVIFADELRRLQATHPHRLRVEHWLDDVTGPPTVAGLTPLLRPYADRDAFVCGPPPFLAVAGAALAELGVPAPRVHVERFQVDPDPVDCDPADRDPAAGDGGPPAMLEVTLDGQTHRLPWPVRTRLLDVLISAGLNPPFSCRQGTCGACACRILTGEVELVDNEVLEDEDFAEGYTLACQALPRSGTVSVTYS